ncbi:hypothetical protein [Methylobacterium sp. Leaf88]|uniref:hypothetical protein n=1 Tax=Methylobacterium sp. Leaf88 TaxID=1736244 RepID=UPI000A60BCD9|nr:hypothetical protein [Methylobacterium sp. Leaf88]
MQDDPGPLTEDAAVARRGRFAIWGIVFALALTVVWAGMLGAGLIWLAVWLAKLLI